MFVIALDQVFFKHSLYHSVSFKTDQRLSLYPWKNPHPHSLMLPPPCFTIRMVMSGAWFLPDKLLKSEGKLGSIRPDDLVSHSSLNTFHWVKGFHLVTVAVVAILVFHLHTLSLEPNQSDHQLPGDLSYQGSSPLIASLSGQPVLACSKLFPFKNYGDYCGFHGNLPQSYASIWCGPQSLHDCQLNI